MIVPSRRGFVAGALALVAAPVIVRAASLMKVSPTETFVLPRNALEREAIKLFASSNLFLRDLDRQYREEFRAAAGAKIGTRLYIRLPNDWLVTDGPLDIGWQDVASRRWLSKPEVLAKWPEPQIPNALALAVGAPVVVAKALEVPVTRRFWGKGVK